MVLITSDQNQTYRALKEVICPIFMLIINRMENLHLIVNTANVFILMNHVSEVFYIVNAYFLASII